MNRDSLRVAMASEKIHNGLLLVQAVELLLDGPLSDILELRGATVGEVWWCDFRRDAMFLDDMLYPDQEKARCLANHNGCGPRLLVKEGDDE